MTFVNIFCLHRVAPTFRRASTLLPSVTYAGTATTPAARFCRRVTNDLHQGRYHIRIADILQPHSSGHVKFLSTMARPVDINDTIAKVLRQKEILQLREIFTKNGSELRLVGGAVRDLLNGEEIHDLDLASPAVPEQIIEFLETEGVKVIATGLQHGTVTAVINHIPFEITTLRIDTDHNGRHCSVQYTQDWKIDCQRRDLTVNAMMMDLDGNVYDYFNGREHLRKGWITFVGDPGERIEEDNLRILRYFRFHGRISKTNEHDPICTEAIRSRADGLQRISGERIHSEMMKILSHPTCCREIRDMCSADVMPHIGLDGLDERHMIELERVFAFTENPVTRLMATVDSVDTLLGIHERWKFPNKELQLATFVVERRHESISIPEAKELLVRDTVPRTCVVELLRYKAQVGDADIIGQWPVPKFPIGGKDLIKHVGMKPSKHMGTVMNIVLKEWIASDYTLSYESLLDSARDIAADTAVSSTVASGVGLGTRGKKKKNVDGGGRKESS